MAVRIRPAEERDAAAIYEFTTNTFSWGDYVAESFLEWLEEDDTALPVAVDDDDRPIGLARVRMLSDRESWLSAARVHPDYRRKGVGSALNDWCVQWTGERGGVVARLQIETWNEPAQNQVKRLGYRQVAKVANARREIGRSRIEPATNGGRRTPAEERLDRAPRAEADGAFIAWSTSELARASHGLFPSEPWAWRRMTAQDAHSARTWFCPSGWVMTDEDGDELIVRWLVSVPEDAERLVRATVDLAQERGLGSLHVVVPSVPWLDDALKANGLDTLEFFIFEKPV